MKPCLSEDIVSCITIYVLKLQIVRSAIKQRIKWAVSLAIVNGYFNHPQGFLWVCMG